MLLEIFGLIQCIIGCVIVFKHSQKVVRHRKWVLHPVVAPIRDPKNASNRRKNRFFSGEGAQPLPQTPPPHPTTSTYRPPPFWNPKYATAPIWGQSSGLQGHLVATGLCAPSGLYSRMKSHRTFKFVNRKCHRSINLTRHDKAHAQDAP